jgi:hypothetical protein
MTSKLHEKPSALKREHPALQKMTFLNFFLFFWVIFAFLDPETLSKTSLGTKFRTEKSDQ